MHRVESYTFIGKRCFLTLDCGHIVEWVSSGESTAPIYVYSHQCK